MEATPLGMTWVREIEGIQEREGLSEGGREERRMQRGRNGRKEREVSEGTREKGK